MGMGPYGIAFPGALLDFHKGQARISDHGRGGRGFSHGVIRFHKSYFKSMQNF
jgi:hypothetical protein